MSKLNLYPVSICSLVSWMLNPKILVVGNLACWYLQVLTMPWYKFLSVIILSRCSKSLRKVPQLTTQGWSLGFKLVPRLACLIISMAFMFSPVHWMTHMNLLTCTGLGLWKPTPTCMALGGLRTSTSCRKGQRPTCMKSMWYMCIPSCTISSPCWSTGILGRLAKRPTFQVLSSWPMSCMVYNSNRSLWSLLINKGMTWVLSGQVMTKVLVWSLLNRPAKVKWPFQ